MKKNAFLLFLFLIASFSFVLPTSAAKNLSGRILLQVESNGEAWYVYPPTAKRAYLGRPEDAFRIMRELGLGISEKDYRSFSQKAPQRLSGMILLRAEAKGEAYYVDPLSLGLKFLGRPADAFLLMRSIGLGITNSDLAKIAIEERYQNQTVIKRGSGLNLYLFYGDGCPYCEKEKTFLSDLKKEFPDLNIQEFEVWNNEANKKTYTKVRELFGHSRSGVPFLVVGDEYVYGFSDEDSTGKEIREMLVRTQEKGAEDQIFPLLPEVYALDRVVDGDTIDVVISSKIERIRVIGIDTPEIAGSGQAAEPFGAEASAKTKELLSFPYVRLLVDDSQGEKDKYGRLLRHVILSNGKNLGEELLLSGLAREYTYSSAYLYQNAFRQAEAHARENKFGIWSVLDTSPLNKDSISANITGDNLTIVFIMFDGQENPNEGDEYVEIENSGPQISLSGYSLSDESGKIYSFPDISLGQGKKIKIYTGCGQDSAENLYWCYGNSAIWNNSGDKASLKNGKAELVSSYEY